LYRSLDPPKKCSTGSEFHGWNENARKGSESKAYDPLSSLVQQSGQGALARGLSKIEIY
jgi:hypothetical protein